MKRTVVRWLAIIWISAIVVGSLMPTSIKIAIGTTEGGPHGSSSRQFSAFVSTISFRFTERHFWSFCSHRIINENFGLPEVPHVSQSVSKLPSTSSWVIRFLDGGMFVTTSSV